VRKIMGLLSMAENFTCAPENFHLRANALLKLAGPLLNNKQRSNLQ
jgi:hypothetical protein